MTRVPRHQARCSAQCCTSRAEPSPGPGTAQHPAPPPLDARRRRTVGNISLELLRVGLARVADWSSQLSDNPKAPTPGGGGGGAE